jgi:hypothetical protein
MVDTRRAEAEMERLAGLHDRIHRLRKQLTWLKQKQSDVYAGQSRQEPLFVTEVRIDRGKISKVER